MRKIFTLLLLLIPAPVLLAEEEAPARRRPRIRVYDQEANVMPVMQPVDNRNTGETEMEKKIRSEIAAPSRSDPLRMISILPILNSSTGDTRSEVPEEEEESWITPMDFLMEEDQVENEELDLSEKEKQENSSEMEIMDWDKLQKSMIKDALKKKVPETTDEELEEMLTGKEEKAVETSSAGGLEMEEISPLQELNRTPDELGGVRIADNSAWNAGNFVPVLPSARQMNGEVTKPEWERNPQLELSGSQSMLNDIKAKWAKPADPGAVRNRGSFELPTMSRENNLPRSTPLEGSLSRFSPNNPAVNPLPATRIPSAREPVRTQAPEAQPRTPPGTIQGNDYRLRSRLGVPSGF